MAKKPPSVVLAIDPGKTTGIALVAQPSSPDERPLLIAAYEVTGSTRRSWLRSCQEAIAEAASFSPAPWVVVCESSPPVRRSHRGVRGAGGDKYGLATAEGMGRYGGHAMMGAWLFHPKHEPRLIKQRAWPRVLRLPSGKMGDGSHRIVEARTLLEMGPLGAIGSVDMAEAALIGAAVILGVV